VNPEHHLFTLEEDRELNLTLYVNRGRGWVPADQHPLPKGSPVDMVRIDAIYNPVLRANFTVEETRVGQRTDFDRLTLQVETNGSMAPDEAVTYAARLAQKHLDFLLRFGGAGAEAPPVPGASRLPQAVRELLERPIDELAEFSVRSVNSLKKENIVTLKDLVQRTEEQMLDIENFGAKSLEEIRQFLQDRDLRFGLELEEGEGGDLYVVKSETPVVEAAEAGATEEEE
jgi:DNA-directed RNA polymerase subunit alpha